MSYVPYPNNREINTDAGGRTRTSLMTTLFDGKTLNVDDSFIWENVGTGTSSFSANKTTLSVTSGQYEIRRGRHTCPYFSAKSQELEITLDQFATQTNVTKRAGYFTSSATAPYTANLDGFFVESDGTNGVSLQVFRDGTQVANIPFASWSGASSLAGYNWNNFTILKFDFLWLGGSELRLFVKTSAGFVLAHTYKHAGNVQDLFCLSPQKSIRYEIRSSTGTGSFRAICSQVSSEGSTGETGKVCTIINTSAIATNSVGTIYALKGVKKTAANRDVAITVTAVSVANIATTDVGMLMVLLNPTISAPLSYVNNSKFSEGTATNQTVTSVGRILAAIPAGTTGAGFNLNDSILLNVGMSITDVSDEIVLAYMATSATQSVFGALTVKEF